MARSLIQILFCAGVLLLSVGCDHQRSVVIYTSLDQNYSEPILREYENQSGVKVKVVYDTEATKTTGLANRLLAEKNNPQADVFWNSEVGRTVLLKEQGVFQPYKSPNAATIPAQFKDFDNCWTGFSARIRILAYNKNLVTELPRSIFELTEPKWKNQVALAYPLFGTTSIHCAALFSVLGEDKAKAFFQDLQDNEVIIVNGNATAMARVAAGTAAICFTDTDDAYSAIARGEEIGIIFPDQDGIGTLLIPQTVALINNARNPDEGKKLIDYLLSRDVEQFLAHSVATTFPLKPGVKPKADIPALADLTIMEIDYERTAAQIPETSTYLKELFIR